jgi:hypothetical protein
VVPESKAPLGGPIPSSAGCWQLKIEEYKTSGAALVSC